MQDLHFVRQLVSIHAPVRERLSVLCVTITPISFNSRSREGATFGVKPRTVDSYVSIHAPVRERPEVCNERYSGLCFNSRSREGATLRQMPIVA